MMHEVAFVNPDVASVRDGLEWQQPRLDVTVEVMVIAAESGFGVIWLSVAVSGRSAFRNIVTLS
jgi:hypothetical protein